MAIAENLLELIKNLHEAGKLRLLTEKYKKKYVEIEELQDFMSMGKFSIEHSKIELWEWWDSKYGGKNAFELTLAWKICDRIYYETYHTWINNAHSAYGKKLTGCGWNCNTFLNIDNLGNELKLEKKYLISSYKSI